MLAKICLKAPNFTRMANRIPPVIRTQRKKAPRRDSLFPIYLFLGSIAACFIFLIVWFAILTSRQPAAGTGIATISNPDRIGGDGTIASLLPSGPLQEIVRSIEKGFAAILC